MNLEIFNPFPTQEDPEEGERADEEAFLFRAPQGLDARVPTPGGVTPIADGHKGDAPELDDGERVIMDDSPPMEAVVPDLPPPEAEGEDDEPEII